MIKFIKSVHIVVLFIFTFHNLLAQSDSLNNCEEQFWKQQNEFVQKTGFKSAIFNSPTIIKQVTPVYPESAKRDSIEGDVVLRCFVDTAGKAQCIEILKSAWCGFDEAAVLAIRDWQFEPPTFQCNKLWSAITIPFRFRIILEK